MSVASTLVLNALVATGVLALVAVGLAIIFGMMGVLNLAHGAFVAVGAYTAWLATQLGSFWLGLLIAPLVVGAFGYAIEVTIVKRLYHRPLDTILATWGIALASREALKLAFGATNKNVPIPIPGSVDLGIVTYPSYRLFLVGVSAGVLGSVLALIAGTDYGVRLRAVIQNPESASLLGLNRDRMFSLAFAFGAGLAGFAGAAIAPIATVAPDMGIPYLIESFFAVILGGTPVGVLLGSAIIAGASNALTFGLPPVLARTVVFAFAIVVVIARPRGIIV